MQNRLSLTPFLLALAGALWLTIEEARAQSGDGNHAAQRFYSAGQAAMEEGDRLRAVAAWRLAVRDDPSLVQGWIALGDVLFETDPAFAATAYRRALDVLIAAGADTTPPTATQPEPAARPLASGGELDDVLAVIEQHLREELGRPVHLSPFVARRYGAHSFVSAMILRPDGRPVDWENTPFADLWAADMMSDASLTLLKEANGAWRIVEHETGPTDVAWFGWMHVHDLPEALFLEAE